MIPFQLCGFAGDERDHFPFAQAPGAVDGANFDLYFSPEFTFEEYIELIWRRRSFRAEWTTNLSSGFHEFANHRDYAGDTGPPSEEGEIFPIASTYPTLWSNTPTNNFSGSMARTTAGQPSNAPNYRWNSGSGAFRPAFQVFLDGAGSFYSAPNPDYTESDLVMTFLGQNIVMYENLVASPTPITGSCVITAPLTDGYWGWDGHFDPDTGAPL